MKWSIGVADSKSRPADLKLVRWKDSRGGPGSWNFISDVKGKRPCIVQSIGWVIAETDEHITLAPHMALEEDEDHQVCGEIHIPKCAIEKISNVAAVLSREVDAEDVPKGGDTFIVEVISERKKPPPLIAFKMKCVACSYEWNSVVEAGTKMATCPKCRRSTRITVDLD